MAHVGLALMLEHHPPGRAIDLASRARGAGLTGLAAADLFQPWLPTGHAPHLWTMLTAAAPVSTGPLGAVVTPNYRHHPATIAQASATLAALYPGRHWLALSAGDAVSDHVTGHPWPGAGERVAGVFEAADLIGKLFANSAAGRDTRFTGVHTRLESSRLWTMPPEPVKILIAAAGPVTARRAGRSADGFITMVGDLERAARLVSRFELGVADARKDPAGALKIARVHVSWAPSIAEATSAALRNWPQAAMRFQTADLRSPFDFAQIARLVRPGDFHGRVLITTDPGEIRDHIGGLIEMGFDEVYVHNVGDNDDPWLETFAAHIRPGLPA